MALLASELATWRVPSLSSWNANGRASRNAGFMLKRRWCCCCWSSRSIPRAAAAAASASAAATAADDPMSVDELLARMKQTIAAESLPSETCVAITGKQWFLEMEGVYKFIWCLDGRFHEQFKGDNFTVEWGHDGEKTWYADFAGRVTNLQLDNLESCILTAWIRSGYWLTEHGQSKLSIQTGAELVDPPVFRQPRTQILNVQLKNYGKVTAYVLVDTQTFLPRRVITQSCGGVDTWEYSDWQVLQPEHEFQVPFSVSHLTTSGNMDSIFITSCRVRPAASKENNATFMMPSSSLKTRDNVHPRAEFDSTVSPHINMVLSESGHFLIEPKLDGHEFGYFILDTGASGLSIGAEYAKTLSMEGFGEVFLLGIKRRVRSRFVRGKEFQLGCLKILSPLFMESSLGAGAVKEGSVVGICGFDVFFYCIAEISMSKGLLSLFNPSTYTSSFKLQWQSMYLLNNVPHVPATINGKETLLLLDTGAGGVDIILHPRAGRELGLAVGEDKSSERADVKAAGDTAGLEGQSKVLASLCVGELQFDHAKCVVLPTGNLDVSAYSSGLLCGDLLKSSVIVTDYQNSCFALVKDS